MHNSFCKNETFSVENFHPQRIWLTRFSHVHLANQDVNAAGDGLHHRIRNPLHNDVTVPRYVVIPGWKREEKKKSQCSH